MPISLIFFIILAVLTIYLLVIHYKLHKRERGTIIAAYILNLGICLFLFQSVWGTPIPEKILLFEDEQYTVIWYQIDEPNKKIYVWLSFEDRQYLVAFPFTIWMADGLTEYSEQLQEGSRDLYGTFGTQDAPGEFHPAPVITLPPKDSLTGAVPQLTTVP